MAEHAKNVTICMCFYVKEKKENTFDLKFMRQEKLKYFFQDLFQDLLIIIFKFIFE